MKSQRESWRKRMCSALLVVFMIIGLCPTFTQVAHADDGSQLIDFSSPNINETFEGRVPGKNEYDIRGITYEDTGEDWQWWDTALAPDLQKVTSFYLFKGKYLRTQLYTKGHWVAFEIKLKNSGDQTFRILSQFNKSGGTADIFLLKQTEAGLTNEVIAQSLTDETKIGTLNCYDASSTANTEGSA